MEGQRIFRIKKSRCEKVTTDQQETLVSFMEAHREFASGRFGAYNGREANNTLWRALASQLNKRHGPIKTTLQWQKTWADMKSTARKRAAEARTQTRLNAGNATAPVVAIPNFDLRILATISREPSSGPNVEGEQVAQPVDVQMEFINCESTSCFEQNRADPLCEAARVVAAGSRIVVAECKVEECDVNVKHEDITIEENDIEPSTNIDTINHKRLFVQKRRKRKHARPASTWYSAQLAQQFAESIDAQKRCAEALEKLAEGQNRLCSLFEDFLKSLPKT